LTVYLNYSQAELDAQYDQRTLVPDISTYLQRWTQHSAQARDAAHELRADLRYGDSASETLDLFVAKQARGLVVFLHGGAWRMLSKAESAYPAPLFLNAGFSFAALDFGLVPTVTLREQVKQCQRALSWLYQHAQRAGAHHIVVAGHSSGAHLAAMLATTDWGSHANIKEPLVHAALLLSGCYDLEPVRLSARNDYLRLNQSDVDDLSPLHHIVSPACPVVLAYGDSELAEFQRQSEQFAQHWSDAGNTSKTWRCKASNHFDMGDVCADPNSDVMQAFLKIAQAP